MSAKRIGILTGGGDVPGLNSVIKTVVYRGSEIDCEVIGIRRGWEGLTHVNLDDPASRARYILPLNRENTRTIDRTGGTYLHSSRTNPAKMKALPPVVKGQEFPKSEVTKKGVTSVVYDMTTRVLKNVETLGLDYLIAIGGDDTLSYAARLDTRRLQGHRHPQNDGQRRAQHRVLHRVLDGHHARHRGHRAPAHHRGIARAHRRVPHLRTRRRIHRALHRLCHIHALLHPGAYRFNLQHLIELLITDKQYNPSNYALIILSEGAEWEGYQVKEVGEADAFGHKKKMNVGEDLARRSRSPPAKRPSSAI
jgi:ATP-dependent phosphofructokinase / diphosphate-dependent phosphofructokinase